VKEVDLVCDYGPRSLGNMDFIAGLDRAYIRLEIQVNDVLA
jgi:hypothetical protein